MCLHSLPLPQPSLTISTSQHLSCPQPQYSTYHQTSSIMITRLYHHQSHIPRMCIGTGGASLHQSNPGRISIATTAQRRVEVNFQRWPPRPITRTSPHLITPFSSHNPLFPQPPLSYHNPLSLNNPIDMLVPLYSLNPSFN